MRTLLFIAAMTVAGSTSADRLKEPTTGNIVDVPPASVPYALQQGYTRPEEFYFRKSDNSVVVVDEGGIGYAADRGWWQMSPQEIADFEAKQPSVFGPTVDQHGRDVMIHLWEIAGVVAVGGVAIW